MLGSVPWGAHLCHFYETEDDLIATQLPFLEAGLAANEFCLWVVSGQITPERALEALRSVAPRIKRDIAKERIAILPYDMSCTADRGSMIAGWIEHLERARRRGHEGMRVAAHTTWHGEEHQHELGVNVCDFDLQIAASRLLVLCAHPLGESSAANILDVTWTHEFAVVRRRGLWGVLDVPRLDHAKQQQVARLKEELELRLLERADQLASASEELEHRVDERTQELAQHRLAPGRLERYAAQLETLARAAVEIATLASADDVLRISTERAREIVGAHQAVTSLSKDDHGGQVVHTTSLSEEYAVDRRFQVPPDGAAMYSLVLRLNRPLRMTQQDLEAHPGWRGFGDYAAQQPLRGWIAVPLIARDGSQLGLLQLSDKDDGQFSDEDEAVLVQLAEIVSVALENRRLLARLEQP